MLRCTTTGITPACSTARSRWRAAGSFRFPLRVARCIRACSSRRTSTSGRSPSRATFPCTARVRASSWRCPTTSPANSSTRRSTCVPISMPAIRAQIRGCTVGLSEYDHTGHTWSRALLQDEYGVPPEAVRWVIARREATRPPIRHFFTPPPGVRLEYAPPEKYLSKMLLDGEIDVLINPNEPGVLHRAARPRAPPRSPITAPRSAPTTPAPASVPIQHVLGVRKELLQAHPVAGRATGGGVQGGRRIGARNLRAAGARRTRCPCCCCTVPAPRSAPRSRRSCGIITVRACPSRTLTFDEFFRPQAKSRA